MQHNSSQNSVCFNDNLKKLVN